MSSTSVHCIQWILWYIQVRVTLLAEVLVHSELAHFTHSDVDLHGPCFSTLHLPNASRKTLLSFELHSPVTRCFSPLCLVVPEQPLCAESEQASVKVFQC